MHNCVNILVCHLVKIFYFKLTGYILDGTICHTCFVVAATLRYQYLDRFQCI